VELPEPDSLVAEQIAYYEARAPEYDDWWLRTGRYQPDDDFGHRWDAGKQALQEALVRFHPAGDVLELAAGTGNLTSQVATIAERLTAVDSSVEALAIARAKVAGHAKVTFVHADLFAWHPPRKFDAVVFGFWLSHVPPGRLRPFWKLVDDALKDDGRVFFVDNGRPVEQAASEADRRPMVAEDATTPWSHTWLERGVSVRELADGRRFRIVKRAWTPHQLEAELAELGWGASVHQAEDLFIHATAVRRETS